MGLGIEGAAGTHPDARDCADGGDAFPPPSPAGGEEQVDDDLARGYDANDAAYEGGKKDEDRDGGFA